MIQDLVLLSQFNTEGRGGNLLQQAQLEIKEWNFYFLSGQSK